MFFMPAPTDPRARIVEEMIVRLDKSVRWLAERTGPSHVAIGRWLKGEGNPRRAEEWDNLLRVLREEEQRQNMSGELKVRPVGRLTLRILPSTYDVAQESTMNPIPEGDPIEVSLPDNGRKHWARELTDSSLGDLAHVGDILVFDDRACESNQVVEAWIDGRATVRLASVFGDAVKLRTLDGSRPETTVTKDAIRGVVAVRIERLAGGDRRITEYRHGMRHRA